MFRKILPKSLLFLWVFSTSLVADPLLNTNNDTISTNFNAAWSGEETPLLRGQKVVAATLLFFLDEDSNVTIDGNRNSAGYSIVNGKIY